jgi:hypothetical protein
MPFCCTHNPRQEPHDERYNEPYQLDDQQSREEAQSDANADHNQREFGIISEIRNGVPRVENLAQLREGHKEDGCNRDEDPKPAMHMSIVSEELSMRPRTPVMRLRSVTSPPSQTSRPPVLWPPPRIDARQFVITSKIHAGDDVRRVGAFGYEAGRRSIIPLCTLGTSL